MPRRTPVRPSLLLVSLAALLSGCGGGGGKKPSGNKTLTITSQPQPIVTTLDLTDQPVVLSVGATGTGALKYQWYYNNLAIFGATGATYQASKRFDRDGDGDIVDDPDDAPLKYQILAGSLGEYRVRISDSAGSVTSDTVTVSLTAGTGPRIETSPSARSVGVGFSTSFTVIAAGGAPLRYQWRKNGADIAGATGATYTIPSAQLSDEGGYSVVVSNDSGKPAATSATANLNVVALPTVTLNPTSGEVNEGQSVTFNGGATGENLSYQWFRKGPSDADFASISRPSATPELTIDSATATSIGTYLFRVSNEAGAVSSAQATLVVHLRPTITTQPKPKAIANRGSATFTVAATGEGTLTYQWYVDGQAVNNGAQSNGATASGAKSATFTYGNVPAKPITSGTQRDPYFISVVVTNAIGSRSSSQVRLDVG